MASQRQEQHMNEQLNHNDSIQITVQALDELDLPVLSAQQIQELELLLRSQKSRLTHFIRKNLRRDDYVDDLIQQTHLVAFRSWGRFRGESKPETWLFGIALNLVKNFRFRDNSYRFQDTEDMEEELVQIPADSSYEPEEALMRQERVEELKVAINHLPLKMQNVVQLVLLEGFSYQDAADELELPVGTVRSRLSRARDMLRVEVDFCQSQKNSYIQ
jgi:RNA polymerase sigma-70 factor (ECF subfamily)